MLEAVQSAAGRWTRGFMLQHLTLTIRRTGPATPERIERDVRRAQKAWGHLWRFWLKDRRDVRRPGCKGTGAAVAIEIGIKGGAHLHVLYYGPKVEHGDLSARWQAQTFDSFVVWVRWVALGSPKALSQGIRELCKYITSPKAGARQAVDVHLAMNKVRRWSTHGIWYRLDRTFEHKPWECPCCSTLCAPIMTRRLAMFELPKGCREGHWNTVDLKPGPGG